MSDTVQEPSMEEILASIRRIISDDDKEQTAAPEEKEEVPEEEEPVEAEEEGTLETEPEVVEVAAEPEPTPEPAAQQEELADVEDDEDEILDLTDMDASDPEPLFEQQAYQEAVPEPAPSAAEPPPPPPVDSSLVSRPQANETVVAFDKLSEKLNEEYAELPIGNGAVTLEGLTRELVRPMLKEWLDQHLPMTVERLVREEIERLVMQSQRRDPW